MTPVRLRGVRRSPSARSRTAVASARCGPICETASTIVMSPPEAYRCQELVDPAGHDLPGVPGPPTGVVDHPDLAKGGRQLAIVVDAPRPGRRRADTPPRRRRGRSPSPHRRTTRRGGCAGGLPELDVRSGLGRAIAWIERPGANTSGELCRSVLVVAHPKGRRPPEHDVELELGVAHRFGKRCELGETVEPFT